MDALVLIVSIMMELVFELMMLGTVVPSSELVFEVIMFGTVVTSYRVRARVDDAWHYCTKFTNSHNQ